MAIKVRCTGCRKRISVDEAFAGGVCRCPYCGATSSVPSSAGGGRPGFRPDVPGAPASYAVWDVDADLVVQAPDGRVAAWSTDPRAGVPGLPDMRASAPVPTCRQTTVRGRVVHDADTPGS